MVPTAACSSLNMARVVLSKCRAVAAPFSTKQACVLSLRKFGTSPRCKFFFTTNNTKSMFGFFLIQKLHHCIRGSVVVITMQKNHKYT